MKKFEVFQPSDDVALVRPAGSVRYLFGRDHTSEVFPAVCKYLDAESREKLLRRAATEQPVFVQRAIGKFLASQNPMCLATLTSKELAWVEQVVTQILKHSDIP